MMCQQDREWQVLELSCSSVCACPWQPVKLVGCYKHNVSRINMEANFGAGSGGNEQQEGGAGESPGLLEGKV